MVNISVLLTNPHLIGSETDVPELQNRGEDSPDHGYLISTKANCFKALNQKLKVLFVLLSPQLTGTSLHDRNGNQSRHSNE